MLFMVGSVFTLNCLLPSGAEDIEALEVWQWPWSPPGVSGLVTLCVPSASITCPKCSQPTLPAIPHLIWHAEMSNSGICRSSLYAARSASWRNWESSDSSQLWGLLFLSSQLQARLIPRLNGMPFPLFHLFYTFSDKNWMGDWKVRCGMSWVGLIPLPCRWKKCGWWYWTGVVFCFSDNR